MGAVSALLVAASFAAAPAPDAFRFDGPSASATVDGKAAALRIGGAVREGTGSAFLRGEDRVRGREMTYGDAGELWVRAQVGGDVYRVELDAVGFPPEAALPRGANGKRWWRKPEGAPRSPEGGVEGGVVLGRVVNGGAGLGVRDMPARRAAVALWGIGRLYRNDELVAPRARILAQALPGARPEVDVFVDQVPAEVAQGGFVHFVLEGAAISEAPRSAAVARRGESAPRRETREERLSRRPTADEMWSDGLGMVVWSDEPAKQQPAPAPPPPAEAANESAPPSTYGAAPVAGATASGPATASAQPYPDTRPGTQTVMVPPPPLMAVPATPLTAPIQYETGQNGGTIGGGMMGGGFGAPPAYGGSGTAGFSPGTGVFNQTLSPPNGAFVPTTPVPTTASPGIPATPPVLNSGTPAVPGGAPTVLPQTPQPINAQPAPIPGATAPVPTQPSPPTSP